MESSYMMAQGCPPARLTHRAVCWGPGVSLSLGDAGGGVLGPGGVP